MAFNLPESGQMTRVSATGTTAITSGFCQVLGFMCAASATQGSLQFFAQVTTSASISPVMPIVSTGSFIRFPMMVSGSGLTIKYTGSLDPNLMLFWLPIQST